MCLHVNKLELLRTLYNPFFDKRYCSKYLTNASPKLSHRPEAPPHTRYSTYGLTKLPIPIESKTVSYSQSPKYCSLNIFLKNNHPNRIIYLPNIAAVVTHTRPCLHRLRKYYTCILYPQNLSLFCLEIVEICLKGYPAMVGSR